MLLSCFEIGYSLGENSHTSINFSKISYYIYRFNYQKLLKLWLFYFDYFDFDFLNFVTYTFKGSNNLSPFDLLSNLDENQWPRPEYHDLK